MLRSLCRAHWKFSAPPVVFFERSRTLEFKAQICALNTLLCPCLGSAAFKNSTVTAMKCFFCLVVSIRVSTALTKFADGLCDENNDDRVLQCCLQYQSLFPQAVVILCT